MFTFVIFTWVPFIISDQVSDTDSEDVMTDGLEAGNNQVLETNTCKLIKVCSR